MKPYNERTPDTQYRDILKKILDHGTKSITPQGTDAISLMAPGSMHFKLNNGYPLITERNMAPNISERLPVTIWQQAVGEIFAFINGARTQDELLKFGCTWWSSWVTEEKCKKRGLETGDLGPGSYGAAFHDFPTSEGGTYNQFKNIIEQMKELPHLKTHFISPWIPQYIIRGKGKQQKVVVAPCHGWLHFRILDNKLTMHMIQRSGDFPVGVPSNMAQYGALAMAIAQVLGIEADEYIHTVSDAHIFVDQIPAVETMLSREPKAFPTLTVNKAKMDIFDFRKEDFTLSDYNPHPGIKGIPVAI